MPGSRLRAISFKLFMILLVGHAASLPALSYEIWYKDVHETMTLMASDCLRSAPQETGPTICLLSPSAVGSNQLLEEAHLDLTTLNLGQVSTSELKNAVRWPDDPNVQVPGLTFVKFVLMMKFWCKNNYKGDLAGGLLCSSHYGPLQFWHAMASSPNEETVITQRKVLAWAQFLYKIAVSDELLHIDHCTYWQEGKTELTNVFAPVEKFPCPKDGTPWTTSTLFRMKCRGFLSTDCDVMPLRIAKLNALGALLHMVQDSYAQGHAARGSYAAAAKTDRVKSKFECLPISQFYTYGKQDETKHKRADKPPRPGRSCVNGVSDIDDPILASAKVLWYVQQKQGDELDHYLATRVFRLAQQYEEKADAGECFAKTLAPGNQCP